MIVNSCMYIWSPEVYSTEMRATAMGLLQVSGRIGSGLSPFVVIEAAQYGGWIPFVIIGIIGLAAAGLGLVLPETKGKEIVDVEDG